jgi:hypothetical protein
MNSMHSKQRGKAGEVVQKADIHTGGDYVAGMIRALEVLAGIVTAGEAVQKPITMAQPAIAWAQQVLK